MSNNPVSNASLIVFAYSKGYNSLSNFDTPFTKC